MESQVAMRTANYRVRPLDDRTEDRTTATPQVAIAVASDDVRRVLTQALESLKAQVVVHQNLRTLRQRLLRDEVDLVITDATLPDANWADVLRFIVRASLATDVLVHSRTTDEGLRSEVMGRGASGLVTPPYSVESLSSVALPWEETRHDIAS